ncbi:hypothetical protein V6N13_054604 [Hibiscus sabdariffa]
MSLCKNLKSMGMELVGLSHIGSAAFVWSLEFGAATRPWRLREQFFRQIVPDFESLPRGPVPPSAGSPCTNIPGGSGHCVVNQINAAGRLFRSPPAFPTVDVLKFAGIVSMEQ